MRVLLDGHALLWAEVDDDRLPGAVRDLVDDPRTRLVLSVATTWELMVKSLTGRLTLPDSPAAYFDGLVRDARFELLPVEQRHVAALPELPQIHDDPFDRMLVAQALVEDLDLVTGDERIRRYPIRTIW
ncbi:MAG TPA: type II toxin-antitoxin system VapC family toxin [Actinomycetota bacterium]|nr:type II toxin-antitoxin system VapC family toxin [Actinomycetota bacterium]